MAEHQITHWKNIPSMVSAREGRRERAKAELSERFQVAIDEAAMCRTDRDRRLSGAVAVGVGTRGHIDDVGLLWLPNCRVYARTLGAYFA